MNKLKFFFITVLILKIIFVGLAIGFPWFDILEYQDSFWILGFWIPFGLMLSYLFLGWLYVRNLNIEQKMAFGNSCYYLGFLFTIATLIISLFTIGVEKFDIGTIASQFATAMISTLLGMFVRICYVSFNIIDKNRSGKTVSTPGGGYVFIPYQQDQETNKTPNQKEKVDTTSPSNSKLDSVLKSLTELPAIGKSLNNLLGTFFKSIHSPVNINPQINNQPGTQNTTIKSGTGTATTNKPNPENHATGTSGVTEGSKTDGHSSTGTASVPPENKNGKDGNEPAVDKSPLDETSKPKDTEEIDPALAGSAHGETPNLKSPEGNEPPLSIDEGTLDDPSQAGKKEEALPPAFNDPQIAPIVKPTTPTETVDADPDEGIEFVIEAYCQNIAAMNSELINSINLYNQTNNVMMYTFGRMRSDLMREMKDDREFKNTIKNFTKRVIEKHANMSTDYLRKILRLNHEESEKYIDAVKERIDKIDAQSVEHFNIINSEFSSRCEKIGDKMLAQLESSVAATMDKMQAIVEKQSNAFLDFQNKSNECLDHVVKTQEELESRLETFNNHQVESCEKAVQESIKRISEVGNECQSAMANQLSQITNQAETYISNISDRVRGLVNKLDFGSNVKKLHDTFNSIISELNEGSYSIQKIFKEFSNELESSLKNNQLTEKLSKTSKEMADALSEYGSTINNSISQLDSRVSEAATLYKQQIEKINATSSEVEASMDKYRSLMNNSISMFASHIEETEVAQKKQTEHFNELSENIVSSISNYHASMAESSKLVEESLNEAIAIKQRQSELINSLKEKQIEVLEEFIKKVETENTVNSDLPTTKALDEDLLQSQNLTEQDLVMPTAAVSDNEDNDPPTNEKIES